MEAVIIRIYARPGNSVKIVENLRKQGLRVIVHSSSEPGIGYEELMIYREIELEKSESY